MILEFYYNSDVDFKMLFDDAEHVLPCVGTCYTIEYHPKYDQVMFLDVCCSNIKVYHTPIIINKIVFDNFWSLTSTRTKKFGSNIYDEQFIKFATQNNIIVDYNVSDNNCMFFTGILRFEVMHPIYQMIHDA